jgi:hypothetical protein
MEILLVGCWDLRSIHGRAGAFYNRRGESSPVPRKGGEHVAKGRSMQKEKKKPKKKDKK